MTSRGPAPAGVHLGFEVGTGEPVSIPFGHMVITGQTQLSGKTTTLEALVARSGRPAVAFVTKRGEGAFGGGRALPPYFRERADWQFVSAILESQLRERMKFERAWIVKACKGQKTLAGVRDSVHRLQAKAREGLAQDVYMLLGEYLDQVVPLIARLPKSSTMELEPGLNVMDLRAYPEQLQGLVVRSALEWVHEKEEDVISIVPEAWKFIPRGRNTPVRMAAIAIAREGAALGNLLWIDVQDLAGADYEVMRGASVWILGVQRERNEVKRAIDQIPAGMKKPKPEDVTSLQRGHFIVCTPDSVRRVYVQPVWIDYELARRVATGDEAAIPAPPPRTRVVVPVRDMRFQAPRLEYDAPPIALAYGGTIAGRAALAADITEPEEDEMASEDVKAITGRLDRMTDAIERLTTHLTATPTVRNMDDEEVAEAREALRDAPPGKVIAVDSPPPDIDEIVRLVADRLVSGATPPLLEVAASRPEIVVRIKREVIEVDGSSMRGMIAGLIVDKYFEAGRKNADVVAELRTRGKAVHGSNTIRELRELAALGFFTIEPGDRFKSVPGSLARVVEE